MHVLSSYCSKNISLLRKFKNKRIHLTMGYKFLQSELIK